MAGDSSFKAIKEGILCILILIVNWLKVQPFAAYFNQIVDLFKGF